MERREERIEASENYANQHVHPVEWNKSYCDFKSGTKWADKTMINKAVKYLSGLTRCAVSCIGEDVNVPVLNKEQLEDFKKAMEK